MANCERPTGDAAGGSRGLASEGDKRAASMRAKMHSTGDDRYPNNTIPLVLCFNCLYYPSRTAESGRFMSRFEAGRCTRPRPTVGAFQIHTVAALLNYISNDKYCW